MSNNNDVKKSYSQRINATCCLCQQGEEFANDDPLLTLRIHYICAQLVAFNLPHKSGKVLLQALKSLKEAK